MKALIIGPGRIGCGFAGQLLHDSGYDVVFAARTTIMTDYFNREHAYKVRLISTSRSDELLVDGVRAVCTNKNYEVVEEIKSADLIVTAVGVDNIPHIAPLIAKGLKKRDSPLNIIAFENLANAGSHLRELVSSHLPKDFLLTEYGFSGALVTRVVSHRLWDPAKKDLITFVGDQPTTFVVKRSDLCTPLPKIKGMIATDEYSALIKRKLFLFNAGHAACAYLGFLKGYHYIHSAIKDPEIREAVLSAMIEGQHGLRARYGQDIAGDKKDLLKILKRFENAALNDSIIRVGRDPRRKLGQKDRLIGAARLAEEAGVQPKNLARIVASALYFSENDSSSSDLHHEIGILGLHTMLKRISGLDPNQDFALCITRFYQKLGEGWQKNNLLLKLNKETWSWR